MPRAERRTVHFVSLGCPKNRVDSEVMLGVASGRGLSIVEEAADADVIVVNTCGFIGEAKKESIDTILELAELKKVGRCEKLVVTGCLAQRYTDDLAASMPEIDHLLGSSDMLKLGEVLDGGADRVLVGNPADWIVRASDPRVLTGPRASAYVKLAEGCNRTCAFCTIPQFRGKQRSREADDIVREVEQLVAQGVREVCLISQDTVSWGRDTDKASRVSLAELVQRVADVPGVAWTRLFYLYPETIDQALIELLAGHPRVVPYVDMPLQHAADGMLKRMRRGHGNHRQRRVVERLRAGVPGLFFRTAFIVGHPGETDEEFDQLVDFVEWAEFDNVGVFRYSDEETAKSHALTGKVSEKIAHARYRRLMSIQRKIARRKNKRLVGSEIDVLVEGVSEEHEIVMKGRHPGQAPEVDGQVYLSEGDCAAGEIRRVLVEQASDYDLVGVLVDAAAPTPAIGAPRPAKKRRVSLRVVS